MKKSGVGGQFFNNTFYRQGEISVSIAAEKPKKVISRLMRIEFLIIQGMFLDYLAGADRLLLIASVF